MYIRQQYVYGYGWTPGLILACDSSRTILVNFTCIIDLHECVPSKGLSPVPGSQITND